MELQSLLLATAPFQELTSSAAESAEASEFLHVLTWAQFVLKLTSDNKMIFAYFCFIL